MISNEKGNFFANHYEWIVVGVGLLALLASGAFFAMTLGEDPDEAARTAVAGVERQKPAETGVKPAEMGDLVAATKVTKTPVTVNEVSEKDASFLASERRVKCKCGKAISGDIKAFPKCPYCGEKQEEEKAVVLDADGDGLPDEWEKKYGLNPSDASDGSADKDGDAFTNLEEYQAKTDPTDPLDHPDYRDSLKLVLPLKETYLPFVFTKATQVPGGWRCQFFDPKKKDMKRGNTGFMTAKVGEEIPGTGYTVTKYEAKTTKRERKGMKGMMVSVDVSEATLTRKSDGKVIKLVIDTGKKPKFVSVDVQATLRYERGTAKDIDVVPGSEITLTKTKFKVTEVKAVGKGASVTIEKVTGKPEPKVIKALEQ